jgi:hypothetical protein
MMIKAGFYLELYTISRGISKRENNSGNLLLIQFLE